MSILHVQPYNSVTHKHVHVYVYIYYIWLLTFCLMTNFVLFAYTSIGIQRRRGSYIIVRVVLGFQFPIAHKKQREGQHDHSHAHTHTQALICSFFLGITISMCPPCNQPMHALYIYIYINIKHYMLVYTYVSFMHARIYMHVCVSIYIYI